MPNAVTPPPISFFASAGRWATWCLILLAVGCASEPTPETERELPNETVAYTLGEHLSDEATTATLAFKTAFDEGLRDYAGARRTLAELYERNALQLRLHFLEEETFSSVFPFNGKLRPERLTELMEDLPYMTNNCGFQTPDGEVVHYYCPGTDEDFFGYLAAVGRNNVLVEQFRTTYLDKKIIEPAFRERMLLTAADEFDFTNGDHQMFYALFQAWILEEARANMRVRAGGGK